MRPTKATGTLVFIVDDDDAVRDSLRLLLETHGLIVHDFRSTAEFDAADRAHPRACLILDLHLPVMSGLDYLAGRRPPALVSNRPRGGARLRSIAPPALAEPHCPLQHRQSAE